MPGLHVVGLDVSPRILSLARQEIADSHLGERIELRHQDVADLADLADHDSYDLAWLPAPFIPSGALNAGVCAIAEALRPGGWIYMGHGKFGDDPGQNSLTRLHTAIYGGTAWTRMPHKICSPPPA